MIIQNNIRINMLSVCVCIYTHTTGHAHSLDAIAISVHDVVPEGSKYVEVNLSDIR